MVDMILSRLGVEERVWNNSKGDKLRFLMFQPVINDFCINTSCIISVYINILLRTNKNEKRCILHISKFIFNKSQSFFKQKCVVISINHKLLTFWRVNHIHAHTYKNDDRNHDH